MQRHNAVNIAGILGRRLSILIASSLLAQVPVVKIEPRAPIAENRPFAQVRVNTDLVLVPVLVTDHFDHAVFGLDKADFRVLDDNVEQCISHFAQEDAPVSVILVFDTSGSMRQKLTTSRVAVGEFLRAANPDDEFALIEFSDRPRLVSGFTQDIETISIRLASLRSGGHTSLVDAVLLALDKVNQARHTRKAILVLSDGGDNWSRHSQRELKKRLWEADVQIFSIAILEPLKRTATPEEIEGPHLLTDIATQTGGRMFPVESLGGLPDIARRIGSALRNQYVLGYSPSTERRDGRYHRIVVNLPEVEGREKLRASFRTGYWAPAQ